MSVKWEVINEDDDNKVNKGTVIKKEPIESLNQNVAEHDIFGGAVSDSEEDTPLNVLELDENSQNSAEDSHLTDSNSVMVRILFINVFCVLYFVFFQNNSSETKILTEFSSDMFGEIQSSPSMMREVVDYYQQPPPSVSYTTENLSRNNIESRLEELDLELADLKTRRQEQEIKIDNIENIALRQRFQDILNGLLQEQMDKEQEKYELQELLKQT